MISEAISECVWICTASEGKRPGVSVFMRRSDQGVECHAARDGDKRIDRLFFHDLGAVMPWLKLMLAGATVGPLNLVTMHSRLEIELSHHVFTRLH